MSLKKQATSGIKWSSVSQIGRQVMQFATTAILARLLSPADFGLLGMATIVIGFVELFKDLGTSAAVIQRKNLSESLVHSIFWINLAFGILGTIILFITSPLVANFYEEPRVAPVLMLLSLTFLISGISILQKALLEKDLAFNKLAKIEIAAVFNGSAIGIVSASLGLGVWSLVYQSLTVTTVTTILLWITTRWKPKLVFTWNEVKQVSSYSLYLTGFNIFNYFSRNADYLLIGKFLGTEPLGYYTLAYRLMLYPLQNISAVLSRVMFPVFSQVQNDNARFSRAYLKVVATIALVTFPIMIGLWTVSEPFILTLFGSQWQPVIQLLMILAPVGMAQSVGTTVGTIYTSKGRTDWMLRWGAGSGILATFAIATGLQWGIVGIATAYAIATATLVYPSFAIPFRLIDLRVSDLIAVVWRPFLASLLMLGILMTLKMLILPTSLANGWILGILVPTGFITYLLASWFINREQMQQFLEILGLKR
ncbi:MAG: MOP flippase family protein [Nostocales cyanobacterium 94392]|nr:MOP flippase family protein [Nostocales cyanobacterium 94392]